jgi:hypothetical protein
MMRFPVDPLGLFFFPLPLRGRVPSDRKDREAGEG